MSGTRKKISIVIPFFNEALNLPQIYQEVLGLRAVETGYDFEILFMDNSSTDDSFSVAVAIATRDPLVRVIRLSRNFGYQANILTGYLNAKGDAAIQLDADGEDDPLLISEFLRKWEAGHDVVYGVRLHREEGFLLRLARKVFYRLISALSEVQLPLDSGDFRLVDRKALDALGEFKESAMYLRGILSYIGFRQIGVPYRRRKRYSGESKFRLFDYLTLAIDGITSFSRKPLFLIVQLGLLISFFSFIGMLVYLGLSIFGLIPVRGFATMVILQLLLTGIQLMCLGINGAYVGRIFDEVKRRPRSLVDSVYPPAAANGDQSPGADHA